MRALYHLIIYDEKFAHRIKNYFDALPYDSTYHILHTQKEFAQLPGFKNDSLSHVLDNLRKKNCVLKLQKGQIVFMHYFDVRLLPLFKHILKQNPIIIQLWGGDYTSYVLRPTAKNLGPETARRIIKPRTKYSQLPWGLWKVIYQIKWTLSGTRYAYRKALKQATIANCELGPFELEHFNISRNSKEHFLVPYSAVTNESNTSWNATRHAALVGNSATISNRHLDLFTLLKKTKYPKLIFPLNYGDSQLKKVVTAEIKKSFENAVILSEFLPKDEYFNLLEDCEFFVFYHLRQQALGNIIWALRNHRTLYLSEHGVTYKYLISQGITVHATENIPTNGLEPISPASKRLNAQLILTAYEVNADATISILDNLLKKTSREE